MKNLLFIIFLLSSRAFAYSDDEMADAFFSKKKLPLTANERKALSISEKWQQGNTSSKPTYAADGSVSYIFGYGQNNIICSVLQVCDIALEPGEVVNNKNIGDPRFQVDESVSGSSVKQTHLLVKPLDVGLDTSLVVVTDKRTYHMRLKSTRKQFMPVVSFIYPEVQQAKARVIEQKRNESVKRETMESGEILSNLDFDYTVDGDAPWKPLRVYNNGTKTIIEMPKTMNQDAAPALLVLKEDGGVFSEDKHAIVNYRLQNHKYIVDNIFARAVLVSGVGDEQVKVSIKRGVE